MSMNLERVFGLLSVVEKAAGHPALAPLGTMALRELRQHAAEAKKEHDEVLAKEAEDAAKAKAVADAKAKKLADEEAKKAELTAKPQEPKRPTSVPVARAADEFEEETTTEPVRRREVQEEMTNG